MKSFMKILCAILALLCIGSVIVACDNSTDKDVSASGGTFGIVYKDITIKLDEKAESILSKLGEPKYTDNLGDCGGIGVQTKYTYDDIAVNTLKEKDGEKIHKIALLNDLVSTSKGISIGDDEASVKEAYGTPSAEANGKLTYKSGNLELEFTLKDGNVTAINYRRIV